MDAMNCKVDEKIEDVNRKMDLILEKLTRDTGSPRVREMPVGAPKPLGFNPKIEFPKFDGTNSRTWIKKCCKYFSLCNIPGNQKVDLASLYMVDKAESWIASYLSVRKNVEWTDFVLAVVARFRDNSGENAVERFNKLSQIGTIESYIDEFEKYRSLMNQQGHNLTEEYMLDSFIGGLKDTIKPFVRAFKPTTICEAVEYARLQEDTLNSLNLKPLKNHLTPYTNTPILPKPSEKPALLPLPSTKVTSNTYPSTPNTKTNRNFKYVPADVRASKIAQGLCFYCDKPFERGHKCSFKEAQLFAVEFKEDSEGEDDEGIGVGEGSLGQKIKGDKEDVKEATEACISVHALTGEKNYHTMRIVGMVKRKPVHILIDSGSTHNFLDLEYAKTLGCELEQIPPQAVSVADGNHIACQHQCKGFTWSVQDKLFKADVMLIQLGSCDMVLGIQWLRTLGEISWDFQNMIMKFTLDREQVVLKGVVAKKMKVIEGTPSEKLFEDSIHFCLLQVQETMPLTLLQCCVDDTKREELPLLQLKQQFHTVFEEPQNLPPSRGVFDHRIPVMPGAKPVNIRPYRYPLK